MQRLEVKSTVFDLQALRQCIQTGAGPSHRATHLLQSNVTYPDATYPSTSDIRQWGVLNIFDSLTYKT